MAFRPPPFWKNSVSGIQQPNISAFGGAGVPNLDKSIAAQSARYSALPTVAQTYGNTGGDMSWWDKVRSNIDKDFVISALGSLGDFGGSPSRSGGGGGGGGGGRGGGGNVQPAGFLAPVLPNIPAQAPNPGFYLNLPKQQKDRYSGGF